MDFRLISMTSSYKAVIILDNSCVIDYDIQNERR